MFSYDLVKELKKTLGIDKDVEIAEIMPAMNKGNLSSIKSGKRHLTEEQALFIADKCGLCVDWVLVQLAEETAKSSVAKEAWHNLAKKLNKSVTAAALILSLVFCGFGDNNERNTVFS